MTLCTSSSFGLIVVVGGEVVGLRDGGALVVVLTLRNFFSLSSWNPNWGGGTVLTCKSVSRQNVPPHLVWEELAMFMLVCWAVKGTNLVSELLI